MWVNILSVVTSTLGFVLLALRLPSFVNALVFLAVSFFCFISFGKAIGRFITARGIFALFWFGSIALSCLRIHPMQTAWSYKTIIALAFVFPAFIAGYILCELLFAKFGKSSDKIEISAGYYYRPLIALGILIIIAFLMDCLYSKDIPLFAKNMAAYKTFGMPMVHYLTVSVGFYPALVLCYCREKEVSIFKEPVLLGFSIFRLCCLYSSFRGNS
ncbi:hypothetical protein OZX57_01675 [Bifidobacterium sp. ESL0682]|uniref:hypothetical protein n=1 Tax=Bifidobacterium sp. ESL0682 TaxID=2983212 RepID=UPI0023F96820|nr:hypothetical protein [Bifidobacterium sp. ESL0682]WEV42227.1 hypothetical protein OZX57_01675 [Bifidobacterium sp. ESL0682]